MATRRRERHALWQDSSVFQDSFFGADTRSSELPVSDFGALRSSLPLREFDAGGDSTPRPFEPPPLRH